LKGLIVTADDFGASRQVNDAVIAAHQNGILTATSLMVSAPAACDAVDRVRATPSLRVGLHVVLTDGRPTLPPAQIPHLVDANGAFRNDMALAGAKMFFLPNVRKQLEAEIEAQFDAFHSTRLPFDHVNAHKHFHLHPSIASVVLRCAKKYKVRAARVPLEPQALLARIEPRKTSGVAMLTAPFSQMLRARFARAGLRTPDQVFGLAWSGAMTEPRMLGLIENLPEGLTEIYCHPATDGAWPGAADGYRYAEELQALTAPEVVRAARNSAIRRGGFADF
jgi:hopanoid biosynthesis associated protein HpnK